VHFGKHLDPSIALVSLSTTHM